MGKVREAPALAWNTAHENGVTHKREAKRARRGYLLESLIMGFVVRHGGPLRRLFWMEKGRVEGDVKRTERKVCCGEKSKLPNRFQSPTHIRPVSSSNLYCTLRLTLITFRITTAERSIIIMIKVDEGRTFLTVSRFKLYIS
jgi:hypothetical protein